MFINYLKSQILKCFPNRKAFFSKVKIEIMAVYALVIAVILTGFDLSACATPKKIEIAAESAILIESRRGQIMYEKEPDKKLHISSANKIMTALLTIEHGNLDSDVTVSKEAANAEGSLLWLKVGEKYNVRQLVSTILLTSANDASQALAEHVGGDTVKFTELMNKKAADLGLNNTHFENPTGLLNENQYTTARDLAALVKYAITNPTFNSMFAYRGMTWIDGDKYDYFINGNEMFRLYDSTDGGKTGFNHPSKHTAITTARENAQRLICIVLDTPQQSLYDDSIKLLDYGFEYYTSDILVFRNQTINKSLMVGNTEVNLVSNQDILYTHPIDDSIDVIKEIKFNVPEKITPPVTRETVIGTASYTLYDDTQINVPLYPDKAVHLQETPSSLFLNRLKENKDLYYLLLILIAMEALILIYHFIRLIRKLIMNLKHQVKG